jgi:hypothetical protein
LIDLLNGLKTRVEQTSSDDPCFTAILELGAPAGPLSQFEKTMEDLEEKLKPATGPKKFGKRLTWNFEKQEIKELFSKIERFKTILIFALQKDHLSVLPKRTLCMVSNQFQQSISSNQSGYGQNTSTKQWHE